jgi:DNA invertase Pin-like site-specific DNA recombinase
MTNYAYLRVSTERQDADNQKLGILEYCNRRRIAPLTVVEDTVSGTLSWRARAIGQLLGQAQAGDVIVAAEVSRLARSTLQVLDMLEVAATRGISVHIVKGHLVLDGSLQATITATILGLAAQIEREFIAARTKEALARRKTQGLPLGRPKGPAPRVKLDRDKDQIVTYLQKGVSKRSIARILECSPSTLYAWLRRQWILLRRA